MLIAYLAPELMLSHCVSVIICLKDEAHRQSGLNMRGGAPVGRVMLLRGGLQS